MPQQFPIKAALTFLLKKKNDDLTIRQLAVLFVIAAEKQTIRGLATLLDLSKPAITRATQKLEGQGLIARSLDPADRRSVFVSVTSAGRKFAGNFG